MRALVIWAVVAVCTMSGVATARPAVADSASEVIFAPDARSAVPVQDQLVTALGDAAVSGRTVRLTTDLTVTRTLWLPKHARLRLDDDTEISGAVSGQSLVRLQSGSRLSGGTVHNSSDTDCFDIDVAPATSDAVVEGVTLRGASANAVYISSSDVRGLMIRRNDFIGTKYGVLLNPGAIRARNLRVLNNRFTRVTGDAIEVNAAIARADHRARSVEIRGNRITDMRGAGDGSGFAIGVAGVDGFDIQQNTIVGARNEAVHLEDRATNGSVEQNRIRGGGVGSRPAVAVYRTSSSIRIANNAITGFRGSGIAVLWDSQGSSTRVTIARNIVRDVVGDGIVIGGDRGTGPFTVERNAISNARGNGITVLGSHALSRVQDNLVRNPGDSTLATRFVGNGVRIYAGNGPRVGSTELVTVGRTAWKVLHPSESP